MCRTKEANCQKSIFLCACPRLHPMNASDWRQPPKSWAWVYALPSHHSSASVLHDRLWCDTLLCRGASYGQSLSDARCPRVAGVVWLPDSIGRFTRRYYSQKAGYTGMKLICSLFITSTPGPLAVNMATFIGSTLGGILGSFVATLGVVLPSFLIILLIASALKNLMKYAPVNAFLSGVRPCVVAMILATALSMALSTLFGLTDLQAGFAPDLRSIAVFAMLGATHLICKKIRKTAPSPILMILFSAGLGILFWCIF